jgi:hypothetical protein
MTEEQKNLADRFRACWATWPNVGEDPSLEELQASLGEAEAHKVWEEVYAGVTSRPDFKWGPSKKCYQKRPARS